jgi:hypothetical protein
MNNSYLLLKFTKHHHEGNKNGGISGGIYEYESFNKFLIKITCE